MTIEEIVKKLNNIKSSIGNVEVYFLTENETLNTPDIYEGIEDNQYEVDQASEMGDVVPYQSRNIAIIDFLKKRESDVPK